MGEIADMMIEGVLCQTCGEYLGEGDGIPRFCAGCGPKPNSARRMKPIKNSGKPTMPFVVSAGSKIVHRVNPKTQKSFCQFENNLSRNSSTFFNGAPPLEFFVKRETKPYMRDCKNCAQLAARLAPAPAVDG